MAKDHKKASKSEDRGAKLESLEISFFSESTAGQWREFVERMRMKLDSAAEENGDYTASIIALPSEVSPGAVYLTGDVHPDPSNKDRAHWHLTWRNAPSSDPPASLVENSNRVGGYDNTIKILFSDWPVSDRQIEVVAMATYSLEPDRFHLPGRIGSRPKEVTFSAGEQRYKLKPMMKMTVWDLDPPAGSVKSISIIRSQKPTPPIVSVNAETKVEFCTELREKVDRILWSDMSAILEAAK